LAKSLWRRHGFDTSHHHVAVYLEYLSLKTCQRRSEHVNLVRPRILPEYWVCPLSPLAGLDNRFVMSETEGLLSRRFGQTRIRRLFMLDQLEAMLRPPKLDMAPYPAKHILLASGETMVVRPASLDEVDVLLDAIDPLKTLDRDFYDIVSARLYAELLGWKRFRVRNEYCLVGVINGELAGIVNGRMFDQQHGISYHTLALKRGLRIGAHLFASKMEHHIEYLGQDEVWIVAESPIGHRRWMIEYPLQQKFSVQHELGGAPSWVLTRETYFKAKTRLVTGARPVPDELLAGSFPIRKPDLRTMLIQIGETLEAKL